jgi:hypothetical protein
LASISADTTALIASNITGPGLFFQGTSLYGAGSGIPFGDGILCAGGAILRLGVVFPIAGTASYPGGPTPNPLHIAGAVGSPGLRYYQCWYRDAASFCTPQTFNLTQAVSTTWIP